MTQPRPEPAHNIPELAARTRMLWDQRLHDTRPADRAAAEEGVRRAYIGVGHEPPQTCIWFGSLTSGLLAARLLSGDLKVNRHLGDDDEPGSPRNILKTLAHHGITRFPQPVVDYNLNWHTTSPRETLRSAACRHGVPDTGSHSDELYEMWGPAFRAADKQLQAYEERNLVWGGHAGTHSRLDEWLFDEVLAVHEMLDAIGADIGAISGVLQVRRSAGYWWAFQDVAVLTERPEALYCNDIGELHRKDGPAVLYRDGSSAHIQEREEILAELSARASSEHFGITGFDIARFGIDPVLPVLPRWRMLLRPPLTALSDGRRSALSGFHQKWIAEGQSTTPANRDAVERAVRRTYTVNGMDRPDIIWCDSPLAGFLTQAVLWMFGARAIDCRHQWDNGEHTKRLSARAALRVQIFDSTIEDRRMLNTNCTTVLTSIQRQLGSGQLAPGVDALVEQWPAIWEQVQQIMAAAAPERALPTPQELNTLELFEIHRADDVYEAAVLGALGRTIAPGAARAAAARAVDLWWPMTGVSVLTEKPETVRFDERGRWHCADGPAAIYRDGFTMYAWHGTAVPADLIETGWDAHRILAERNIEIRRCAIERIGWDAFLEDLGSQPIASAADPGNPGHTLYLHNTPFDVTTRDGTPMNRVLLCTNGSVERDGSRRRYGLLVPGRHEDPVAAAAELYGVPVEAYRQLEIRR